MTVEHEHGCLMKPISLHEIWIGATKCRHCAVRNSALFAGLQESTAEAACKDLKRSGFACFAMKN